MQIWPLGICSGSTAPYSDDAVEAVEEEIEFSQIQKLSQMWPEGKGEVVTWVSWVERKSPREVWFRPKAPRRQGCGTEWSDP